MSWILFAQLLILIFWGAIMARYVVEGIHRPLRDRKSTTTESETHP